jgi:hypothetical protein
VAAVEVDQHGRDAGLVGHPSALDLVVAAPAVDRRIGVRHDGVGRDDPVVEVAGADGLEWVSCGYP